MFTGYTKESNINIGEGKPATFTALNYNIINGYNISEIPVSQPYGFCSLAPDNSWAFYQSLGQGFYASYITGYFNTQDEDSNLSGLSKGESATFNSTNFTRQLKLNGAFDIFTGAIDRIQTAAINGGNTNQILIDLCAEISALETYINTFVTAYNIHIHSGVQTGIGNSAIPTITSTAYTPSANFTRDKNFLDESPIPNLIDINGKVLS